MSSVRSNSTSSSGSRGNRDILTGVINGPSLDFEVLTNANSSSSNGVATMSLMNQEGVYSMTDITFDQALDRVQELSRENMELKDYLKENNELMKKQFESLATFKENIMKANRHNLEKFEQTKQTILAIKQEKREQQAKAKEALENLKIQVEKTQEYEVNFKKLLQEKAEVDQELRNLHNRLKEMTTAMTNDAIDTVFVAKSIGDDVKIHKLERLVEENEYALKCSSEQMQQLMEECKRNKDTTNQLLNDVQQIQKLKNQLQEENSIITKENEVLKQQLQTFSTRTLETRDRSRAIVAEETNDITSAELNARLGGLDLDLTRVSEAIQQQGYDGQERCMSGMVKHLQDERQTVSDLRNKITERDQKLTEFSKAISDYELQLSPLRQQVDMLLKQRDSMTQELQQVKSQQFMSHTTDVQALKAQVLTLLTEVQELTSKLTAAKASLDKKTCRCDEVEKMHNAARSEFNRQRSQDDVLINSLKEGLHNCEQALLIERQEHQNTRKHAGEIHLRFNQLMPAYRELLTTFENFKASQNVSQDTKILQEKINQLTAQLVAAEYHMSDRDEEITKLKDELKHVQDDCEKIPVLAMQAEVYKADFDAERAAREKQHAEKETIFAEMQNLQLRNEQLIEELDNYSKKQVAEMQRRHSSMAPVRPLTGVPYGPGPGYVNVAGGQTDNIQLVNPQIFSRQQPFQSPCRDSSQHDEGETDNPPLICPKCALQCPDFDSLQVHVIECLDIDN